MKNEPTTMSEGKAMDLILEYCLNNKQMTHSRQLKIELFQDSDITVALIDLLLKKISAVSDDIAIVSFGDPNNFIRPSSLTKHFLDQGGFQKEEQNASALQKKNEERDALELEKMNIDLALAKKMLKDYPWTKWFARIAFLIGTSLSILKLIETLSK